MTTGRRERSKKSLCEKSMNIVVNIIKVSSLSLAKISLGSVAEPPPLVTTLKTPVVPLGSTTGTTTTKKLVEPETEQKLSSYLMEPGDDINWRAVQYINGIHERNIHESKKRSGAGDYMLIPPPPYRTK